MKLLTSKEVKALLHVTDQTLYNWRKNNTVPYSKISDRIFLYDISSKIDSTPSTKANIIYARVSNTKQKFDLEKQISTISNYMINNGIKVDEVYEDIASGMNENRIDFNKLLDRVINNEIDSIYVLYKDRFTRFGFGYFEKLFSKYNTKIVILNNNDDDKSFESELTEDLISIIHHFSMKMYSNRRNKLKKLISDIENDN